MAVAVGYDAIRTNISRLPKGAAVYAGYSTGSGVVPWAASDFAAHATALGPCLRIDQDPAASDPTADYLDVEGGAATVADCPGWARRALNAYKTGKRPGQRSPAIYMSQSSVSAVVDSLIAGGVTSGVGLVIANWSVTEVTAVADVINASGPFPIVGIQFADPGPYDVNVFSRAWLLAQSGRPAPGPVPVPVPAPAHVTVAVTLPVLAQGATGVYVGVLQGVLIARGHVLKVDGNFGPGTKSAVQAFQKSGSLAQDGVVGKDTWTRLLA